MTKVTGINSFFFQLCNALVQSTKIINMKKNMGTADRIIRIVIAAIAVILYFTGTITGVLGIALMVVAAIFLLTSFVSFCPLYTLLGLRSCPIDKSK